MTDFFDTVPEPVAFAGQPAGDGLAYQVYDPDRIVAGKRMEDQLRIGVCYWHSFAWPGADIFGHGTFDRPWLDPAMDPMDAAFMKQDAAFEFVSKLGVKFLSFHDVDMAPPGATLAESKANLDVLAERAAEKMADTGINFCLLYTSPSPRDATLSRMPSSA